MTTRKLVAWAIRLKDGSLYGTPNPHTFQAQRDARWFRKWKRNSGVIGKREGRIVRVTLTWLS